MKIAVTALLVGSATAFTTPPLTFAVGKKSVTKPVVEKKVVAKKVVAKKVVAKKVVAKKVVAKKAGTKVVAEKKVAEKKVFVNPFAKKVVAVVAEKAGTKKVVAKKVVAKKVVAKKVAAKKVVAKKAAAAPVKNAVAVGVIPSTAIPGELAPALLDGSLTGDVGFDPCFLSTKADLLTNYFNGIVGGDGPQDGLTWYREAELMHGRICMVAVVGFIWPGLFGTFEGNDWTGADAYSTTNALEAFGKAPSAALFQIFAFMGIMEFRRINIILTDGAGYQAGDSQKWGQGEGRWNPLGLAYDGEQYEEKKLQEIKHARLAMVGFLGLILQGNASGMGVIEQIGGAFIAPEYATKAGYFLPEGI